MCRNQYWKSICRAALLNNNAPDSELSNTGSSPLGEQQFLISTFRRVIIGQHGAAY